MIERDLDVPAGIDALRAAGTVTRHDYVEAVAPLLDAAAREHRRLRLLCVVDDSFSGLTPGALWDDLRLGPTALRHLCGCAVVSDLAWVRQATRTATFFLPAHVRVYRADERAAAIAWLADLPLRLVEVNLRHDEGVVVAELGGPLRREDVDQVLAEVDDWLETHAELPGLVLHAPTFPGWENLTALIHHLRFVAVHQSRIQRVGLVVPGSGVEVAAEVARTLLHPEVRRFDDLDDAVRWAAAPVRVG